MKTKHMIIFKGSKKQQDIQYALGAYRQIRQAIYKILKLINKEDVNQINVDIKKWEVHHHVSRQLKRICIKRSIINEKENVFIKDLIQKLKQLNNRKWKCLKNKQRTEILLDLLTSLKIIEQRIIILDLTLINFKTSFLKQDLLKELRFLRMLVQKQTYKDNQTNIFGNQNQSRDRYLDDEIKNLSSLTITRPSSCNPISTSGLLMQNQFKNKKNKNISNIRKFYSHHNQQGWNDQFMIKKLLKPLTAKVKNRNTLQDFNGSKWIEVTKKIKSKSTQKQAYEQQLCNEQNLNKIKEQKYIFSSLSNNDLNLQNNNTNQRNIKDKESSNQNNNTIKSRQEAKMIKFDNQYNIRNPFNYQQSSSCIKKQQVLRRDSVRPKRTYMDQKNNTKNSFFRNKNQIKHKFTQNRKKRGKKRTRKSNQSTISLQKNQNSICIPQQQAKNILIQAKINEKLYQQKKQQKSQSNKLGVIEGISFNSQFLINQYKIQIQQKGVTLQIIKTENQKIEKSQKIFLDSSFKNVVSLNRNIEDYKKDQYQLYRSQFYNQNIQDKNKRNCVNIIQELKSLKCELKKQNNQSNKEQNSSFYKDQQIIRKIDQRNINHLFRNAITAQQLVKSFNIFYSESSSKILNIKKYQRLYAFMSDNQWIKNKFLYAKYSKVQQKDLDLIKRQ